MFLTISALGERRGGVAFTQQGDRGISGDQDSGAQQPIAA